MFKFFNKQKTVSTLPTDTDRIALKESFDKSSTSELIKGIHNEFNTASDKLLADAKALINATQIDEELYADLDKFGFKNTKQMSKAKPVMSELNKNKQLALTIERYSRLFPEQKFILPADVKRLCDKYNLILGLPSEYTGEVPRTALEKMKQFSQHLHYRSYRERLYYIDSWSFDESIKNTKNLQQLVTKHRQFLPSSYAIDHERVILSLLEKYEGISILSWKVRTSLKDAGPFLICAPASEMKVEQAKITFHVPDPVILSPVQDGYLIVAAWGEEAGDPIVLNGSKAE